jgi:hypothetical protein
VLSTEDPKVYSSMLVRVARDIQPTTYTEWTLLKDIADLNWEMRRMRRLKPALKHRPTFDAGVLRHPCLACAHAACGARNNREEIHDS